MNTPDPSNPSDKLPTEKNDHKPHPKTPTLKYFIIILILMLFAATGIYVATTQNQQQTLQPPPPPPAIENPFPITDTPSATKNWKTYTNYQYGFTIHHPTDLKINEEKFENYYAINFASEYNPDIFSSIYINFAILIYSADNKVRLEEWLNKYVIQELTDGKTDSILSGEITSYKNSTLKGYTFIGGTESENKYVVFKNDNNIFVFILSGSGTGGSYKENEVAEPIFDQILSTFQFTQ